MLRKRLQQSNGKEDEQSYIPVKANRKMSSPKTLYIILLLAVFILYVIIPFTIYLCPAVRRHAVFLHYVSLSRQKNLSLPTESGMHCTRNFYISSKDDIKLGAWHVPSHTASLQCKQRHFLPLSEAFRDSQPVFLYLHGNAGTRNGGHRVELYKVLSEQVNAHVIAFDYRGYADSTNVSPTEEGLVQDTKHVYDWLCKHVNPSRIFIWGHSLGTGVGVSFLDKISNYDQKPAGLILEAPFTRIVDAAYHHPLSIFHRYMPFFDVLIANPIGSKETAFDSLNKIGNVKCPLLILHAEDDGFVPFDQGRGLYEQALQERENVHPHLTQFVGFDEKLDLGHKNIYKNPDLPNIIKKFIENIQLKSVH